MQAHWSLIDSDSNLIRSYCRDFHRPFANHPVTNHTHLRSSLTMTPLNWTRDNSETVLTVCLPLSDWLLSQLSGMAISLSSVGRSVVKQVCLLVSQVLVGQVASKSVCWSLKCRSVGRLANKSVCWSLKCWSVSWQTSLSVGFSSVGRLAGKQVCPSVSQVLIGRLSNKFVWWSLKCRSVRRQTSLSVGLSINKSVCWSLKCWSVSWKTSLSVGLSSVSQSVGKQVCLLVSQVSVSQLVSKSVCRSIWLTTLLYLSRSQSVVFPSINLLLALLWDLDLARVPVSSAKLEKVWKSSSARLTQRIELKLVWYLY